jgi:hypothetical protein
MVSLSSVVRAVLVEMVALAPACGNKGAKQQKPDQSAVDNITATTEDLKKEEDDVLSRRDELSRARKQITSDRAALDEKRKQVVAAGGDTSAVDKEAAEIADREQKLSEQESTLDTKIDALMAKYQSMAAPAPSGTDDATRREAGMAIRERDVATREARLAEREKDVSAREKALADWDREKCPGTTTTIVQQASIPAVTPPPAGSRYTKKDVEPILQHARRKMAEKGLLEVDLPAQAAELEKESTAAMADGDYGKAKFAADQLFATVDAIKVDKTFVSQKIGRLNAAMKGKQLTPEQQQLFQSATADIGDGKFASANAKLNKIYSTIH